jgi:uncharacterized protein (TIGR00299 family) protein
VSRILWIDGTSGAAGDMMLGALVDLGLPLDALRAELAKLPLSGYRLEARRVLRAGLSATQVEVLLDHHDHHHRGLSELLGLLEASSLQPRVKAKAGLLFRRLAEAEAAVHGTTVEAIHFHEVGAVDSIVDVVGGVIGLAWLGAERVVAAPLDLGTGTVTMAHGTFSVPPPATARLVQGVPVTAVGAGECTTPTGALLVTGHADAWGPLPPMAIAATGHGAGTRDTPGRPNVLRLVVGEAGGEAAAAAGDGLLLFEAQVDDMPPQLCEVVMARLLAAGALDAWFTAITMKKGRLGILISALAPPAAREAIEAAYFAETTTLGVRRSAWQRTELERERVPVATAYGEVGIKVGRQAGAVRNAWPEFEECRRAAEAHGVPVKEVQQAALAAWRARDDK